MKEIFGYIDEELGQIISTELKEAIQGTTDCFTNHIIISMYKNPQMKRRFAETYIAKMYANSEEWGIKSPDKIVATLSEDNLALLEYLETHVSFGLDLETLKTAIYTNDFTVLRRLQEYGMIEEDLDELYAKYTSRRRKMLATGVTMAIRLDIDRLTEDGFVIYKPIIPQYMPMVGQYRFLLTPICLFYYFEQFLNTNPYPIKAYYVNLTNGTERRAIITSSTEVLKHVLPLDMATSRIEQRDSLGFNPLGLAITVYNLESSRNESGFMNIRLEELARLEVAGYEEIDKNLFDLGLEVRLFFNKFTSEMTSEQIKSLDIPEGILTAKTEEGVQISEREAVLTYGNSLSNKRLYYFLLLNSHVYGDVQTLLQQHRAKYKELYKPQIVDLPENLVDRKAILSKLASNGVIEFVYQSKNGNLTNKRMSNNHGVLRMFLNPYYVEQFETVRKKMEALLWHFRTLNPQEDSEFIRENLLHRYRLTTYVDQFEYYEADLPYLIAYLEEQLEDHKEATANSYGNNPTIFLRSLHAKNKHSFIQSLNVESIVSSIKYYPLGGLK